MIKMKNKKAVSPVITTILLILVAIVAVGILSAFVKPWITENLRGDCFRTIDQIEIDTESKYTCWQDIDGDLILNLSVKRGSEPLGIERFIITVYGEGTSETFDIGNGANDPNIAMINQPYNTPLEIPARREMRTYSLNTSFTTEITSAEIAPVVEGDTFCNAVDKKNIGKCT